MTQTTGHNRTATVSPAARGIGESTGRRLAADGFTVAVIDPGKGACKPVVERIEAAGRAIAPRP